MGSNVTLKQIARELGLSAMTVSRVINNKSNVETKTRARVLKKAKELGYIPNHVAKSLVSKKTFTIGVVLPEIYHVFFSEVVSGIEDVTYEYHYQLFLTNSAENQEREKNAINALISKRVDGLLISCAESASDLSFYKDLANSGLPIVFFDRGVEGVEASTVMVNDFESSKKITEHLIKLGRKKIAHLAGPDSVSIGKKRRLGYEAALKEHQLPLKSGWIKNGGFQESGGYEAMKEMLALPEYEQPDALVCVNDPVAFGAIKAMQEFGKKIPEDVAIVGFSDDIRSELMPSPLTTVRQPAYKLGQTAAKKLIQLIENKSEHIENIELESELIIRKSCGSK